MPKINYIDPHISEDDYYTPNQVAKILKVSPYTIADYRQTGKGPKYIDVSYKVKRYLKTEVNRYLKEREKKSTSDNN